MKHTPESILEAVSEYYSVPIEMIKAKGKTLQIVHARSVCAYLYRHYTWVSPTGMPNYFDAYGDHTAASRAIRKITDELSLPKVFNTCNEIPEILKLSYYKSNLLNINNPIISN